MPYSFTQIEQEKSRTIWRVFVFVAFLYFFTFYGIAFLVLNFVFASQNNPSLSFEDGSISALADMASGRHHWRPVPMYYVLAIFAAALMVALFHWLISIREMVSRILGILRAKPVNISDSRHQIFQNVISEVSAAIGGRPISGYIISSSAMNAFAISDFDDNAVIGVTEGLLARLNRSQLEAVVAHEAAHIASGDSLVSSVAVSIFAVYNGILDGIRLVLSGGDEDRNINSRGRSSGRGFAGVVIILMLIYAFVGLTRFLSTLLQMFISRQRELRADAVAVRLTRNPLALAEALFAISYRWRGSGLPGESMGAIFIVNPEIFRLDEAENVWADLFSTHPPVRKRLNILLDLARADIQEVENTIRNQEPPAVTEPVFVAAVPKPPEPRWMVCNTRGDWEGLYTIEQIRSLGWLTPEAWIKKEGGEITPAYMEPVFNAMFCAAAAATVNGGTANIASTKTEPERLNNCPRCHVPLGEILYEGVRIQRCNLCQGVLVKDHDDIFRIIVREEMKFPERIAELAKALQDDFKRNPRLQTQMKGVSLLACPRCADRQVKMLRQFYTMAYPVEIDRCFYCQATWFDKDELELLQYMLEKKISVK